MNDKKLTPAEMLEIIEADVGDIDNLPDEADVAPAPKKAPATAGRRSGGATGDGRSALNHATSGVEVIGGIEFRRARGGLDHSDKKALDINPKYLNNDLEYRWVNDINGRVERLSEYGYAKIESSQLSKDEEISVRRRVGSKKDGTDLTAVLMATPKKWLRDRQNKKEEDRRLAETRMFEGPQDDQGKPLGNDFYNKGSSLK